MQTTLVGRITLDQGLDGTVIRVPSKRGWQILFLLAWLAFWLCAPFASMMRAFHSLSQPASANWFDLLWSVGWFFGIWFAASAILWNLAGAEILRISPSELELRRTLFGLVVRRRFSPIAEVRNLRYMPASGGGRRYRAACVCYEDRRGTVKIGSTGIGVGLDDAEGLAIINQMLTVYPFPKKDKALEYVDLG